MCATFWLQMFPVAVTCGNTFILKPSEKDPGKDYLVHILCIIFGALSLQGTSVCQIHRLERYFLSSLVIYM
jgi:acyl-CoA reductase-like NAD-dependent aldehyde dehydrogenase